ncbi:MAG TPA: YibE/F family protein [Patescibacteria group bacterium]|nr:YibE/F family protein [Patescibacteria group bacterium]
MRRISRLLFILVSAFVIFSNLPVVHAKDTAGQAPETFYKAEVEAILDQGEIRAYGFVNPYQKVKVKIENGDIENKEIVIVQGQDIHIDPSQLVQAGQTIVVTKIKGPDGQDSYQIADTYRLDKLTTIIIIFFIAIIVLSGWQGLGSIFGMIVSLVVIAKFVIPQILAGHDPLFISIVGCLVIMFITIYLAHGFSKKTTIALISTFLTLILTGALSTLFVHMTFLSGLGSDDAYALQIGPEAKINFRGLLLGGILIGTLGVLDDVTTGLSASVFELYKANPKISFGQLLKSGLAIGREHISSLVNTLVLAYAGASLPIFLTLVLNPNNYPLWSILNSELIVEEIVRTLAGSIGLVAAVPLTTFLATIYITEFYSKSKKTN